MKDPLCNKETPYDVLEIDDINLSSRDIQKQWAAFVKKPGNKSKVPKGMDAMRKLRGPRDRIEVDFFYYSFGKLDIESQDESEFRVNVEDYLEFADESIDSLYTDLEKNNFSEEVKEITWGEVDIGEIDSYDDVKNAVIDIALDK